VNYYNFQIPILTVNDVQGKHNDGCGWRDVPQSTAAAGHGLAEMEKAALRIIVQLQGIFATDT